ncbi:hypothetical protein [Georgenia yuyongxinii]
MLQQRDEPPISKAQHVAREERPVHEELHILASRLIELIGTTGRLKFFGHGRHAQDRGRIAGMPSDAM